MATAFVRYRKRWHLKRKMEMTQKKIWDLEFLREKMRSVREGFRVEYDRIKEMLDAAERRIKQEREKEDPDRTIIESMERMKDRFEPDMKQLEEQMGSIDKQIEGEGGINEGIEGFVTVLGLLKEYRKKV